MKIYLQTRQDAQHIDAASWDGLAEVSASPNPFYERWLLLPALKWFDQEKKVFVVTVYDDDNLVCLFPVCFKKIFGQKYLEIWRYQDCYLTDILLDEKISGTHDLFKKIMVVTNTRLVVSTNHTMSGFVSGDFKTVCQTSRFRGAVIDGGGWDAYFSSLSSKRRSEYRRVIKRLFNEDNVEYIFATRDIAKKWLPVFEKLECEGWKGVYGNAIAKNKSVSMFYKEALAAGEKQSKVYLQAIMRGQKPLAVSFSYITRNVSYEIKTTFCEKNREYYPGIVLELLKLKNILNGSYAMADSCAVKDNNIVNKLWPDRVEIFRSLLFRNSMLAPFGKFLYMIRRRLRKIK